MGSREERKAISTYDGRQLFQRTLFELFNTANIIDISGVNDWRSTVQYMMACKNIKAMIYEALTEEEQNDLNERFEAFDKVSEEMMRAMHIDSLTKGSARRSWHQGHVLLKAASLRADLLQTLYSYSHRHNLLLPVIEDGDADDFDTDAFLGGAGL